MRLPPSITVITPSYNQGQYIAETIQSVASQVRPGLEHLVMDGGSTDATKEVLARFSDQAHLRCYFEPDRGQSDAINKGIHRASGEVVGWLNSDDLYFPGALDAISRAFVAHSDAGVIYGAGAKVDATGSLLKDIPHRPFDRARLRSAFYILQPSMFFRRDLFLQVGGLNENLHYAMDWELILKLSALAPVYSIHEPIGQLRCHAATKTSSGGWERMREIAGIGRAFHGLADRNYLSFRLRSALGTVHNRLLRRIVDTTMECVYGRGRYMVDGWPADLP